MLDPPPPKEAADPLKKRPWSKPAIRRIVDGALETRSGADPHPDFENSAYVSSS